MRNSGLHTFFSKAACLWLIAILCYLPSFSQTTNISGTINTYHRVIEVIPAKACVRVASTAGLTASSKVLLIQMKGATINTANAVAFGDTTSLNNAGNYEMGAICTIIGDSVFLVYNILNDYTPATGKVQLVKFGDYVNANVTSTLTASPWNNAGGTGGVIAIFAEGDLILNAPISADGAGLRGGAYVQSNTACNNTTSAYIYDASNVSPVFGQRGAYKGEGIVDVTVALSGGRGAPANGGGGGNNHNNSGGGGANLGTGGIGGGNSSTSTCHAAFPGEGGKALSNWGGRKIFLGGGGGAGHNNNAVFTLGGGNGGGIIFIHAANIISNGYKISASGAIGGNSQADGAGGGGGGGTVILDASAYADNIDIEAKGGAGGGSNDGGNIGLCYGGGGGGGGGAIYFSGSLPVGIANADTGTAGLESGIGPNCDPVHVTALAGTNGQIITGYTYRRSHTLASYCSTILPVRLQFFEARAEGKKVMLNWQTPDPEDVQEFRIERMNSNNEWITIQQLPATYNQQDYKTEDYNPKEGYNLYRLKVTEHNGRIFYSSVRRAYIEYNKAAFSVYPNPAIDNIKIEGNYNGMLSVVLHDVSGKIVFSKKSIMNNTTVITLPHLPAGVYMLQINDSRKKLVIR